MNTLRECSWGILSKAFSNAHLPALDQAVVLFTGNFVSPLYGGQILNAYVRKYGLVSYFIRIAVRSRFGRVDAVAEAAAKALAAGSIGRHRDRS